MAKKEDSHVLIDNKGLDILDGVGASRNVAFQKMLKKMNGSNGIDEDTQRDKDEKNKQEREREAALLMILALRENAQDFNNDDDLSLLLSYDSLEKKNELTERDIQMADTRDARVMDMRILRVRERGSSADRYLLGSAMTDYISSGSCKPNECEGTTIGALQHRGIKRDLDRVDYAGNTGLAPDLVKRMNRDPKIANYVAIAQREAAAVGIDGNMYANQLWQESRFNPTARSHAGAMGIAQMMPDKLGKFGINSKEDFYDPEVSIKAGAKMMAGLTGKYGDQRLALVAYNGGGKAISFAEQNMGRKVSFEEWHGFMSDRRERLGSANRGAWHVETLDYTNKIALVGKDITGVDKAKTEATLALGKASATSKIALDTKAPSLEIS